MNINSCMPPNNKFMLVNSKLASIQPHVISAHSCQSCQPQGKVDCPILIWRRSFLRRRAGFCDCSTKGTYQQSLAERHLLMFRCSRASRASTHHSAHLQACSRLSGQFVCILTELSVAGVLRQLRRRTQLAARAIALRY